MKTILKIVMVIVCFAVSSKFAFADTYEDSRGLTWNYSYNSKLEGAVVNSVSGYFWLPSMEYPITDPIGEVQIPFQFPNNNPYALHYNLPTVEIGRGVFSRCDRLTEVVVPSSIVVIGDSAFLNCTNLRSVASTYNAHGVVIHNGVTDIENYAFFGCSKLASVVIPDSVINLGAGAFEYCAGLKSVIIGNGVTGIWEDVFAGCCNITAVTIPQLVCSTRLSYVFPSSYQNITNVVMSASVGNIGDRAFSGCISLTSVSMPDSVTNIEDYAFYNCSSLNSVTIPNGVTKIGMNAFFGCSRLANVTIPSSVKNIGNGAFSGTQFYNNLPDGMIVFGKIAYKMKGSCPEEVIISNDVEIIGDSAFSQCKPLSHVTIPNSVTSICDSAFAGCNNLSSIKFEGDAPTIGQWCFLGVKSSCTVYVDKDSTGWNVAIPGSWNGMRIEYAPTMIEVSFDTTGGSLETADSFRTIISGTGVGILPVPIRDGYLFTGWWTEVSGGAQISEVTTVTENVTYYAQWTMLMPIMVIEDGVLTGVSDWNGCNTLIIPDSITSISAAAFRGNTNLTSVTLGNNITNIGNYAFDDCCSLTNIIMSDSVIDIGAGAFEGCMRLTSITIPDVVKSVGASAFWDCGSLTNVVIGSSVADIGEWAFRDCKKLTNMILPDSVTSIGDSAFRNCGSLTNVVIGSSVTNIGYWAFRDCKKLTSMIVPDSVTSVGEGVFYGCGGLVDITLPFVGSKRGNNNERCALFGYVFGGYDDDAMIGIRQDYSSKDSTFSYIPSSLRTVTITDESIFAYGAFSGCSGLTDVSATKSLMCIESRTFSGCSSLVNVAFPNSVMSIGETAFDGTPYLDNQPEGLMVLNYFVYKIKWPCPTSIVIPDGVTSIGRWAFSGYSGLTSVTIPDSMKNIGYAAFANCGGLTNVAIPDGVMNIGDRAFESCSGLTGMTIPASVTNIGDRAFKSCSGLTSMRIPASVTNVGNYAFRKCSCLGEIVFMGNAPTVGSGVFSSVKSTCVIKVARGSVGWSVDIPGIWNGLRIEYLPCGHDGERTVQGEAEPTCTEGGYTGDIICDICGEVVESGSLIGKPLGHNMGAGVTTKEPTFLEDGVITHFCTRCGIVMKTESIPKLPPAASTWILSSDGKTLEAVELNGCTEFVVPDGVTSIAAGVFKDCAWLTNVTLPEGIGRIGDEAFSGCSNLTNVTLPCSVERIGCEAFMGCISLTEMTIPDSVTHLGDGTFSDCTNLQSVTIGKGVWSLPWGCFYNCNNLKSAFFEGDAPYVVDYRPFPLDCCAYVRRNASGWRMPIPGVWNGIAIDYIHHTISFNANGGVCETESLNIADGATIGSMPVPTLPKFDFVGWFTMDDGGIQIDESTMVSEDMTLYAHWEIKRCTVVFDANGGSGGKTVTQDYGTAIVAPIVTREGYTFAGWSPAVPSTVPASNVTYTAQWTINQYTVTFNANGGNGGASGAQDYSTTIVAPTVTREGYTFAGWSPAVLATVPASDVTYMAQWAINNYTLAFDANGGTGGETLTQNYGTAITAPDVTRTGYTFIGWTPAVDSTVPASNITYMAQWAINNYTMTFDANGGVYDGGDMSIDYGSAYGELPEPTREGHTFAGWTLDGEPVMSESVMGAADVSLVAQWTVNQYSVIFDANGGDGGKTVTQDYGTALAAPTVTRAGYTFTGWSPSVPATVPTANATYVAQWKVNQYKVTFNANGGEGGKTLTQDYGTAVTAPTVTRTGHTFTGWTPEVAATVPANEVTYMAQWKINQYTVMFDANGGDGGKTVTQDYGSALAAPTMTRTGYTFAGWSSAVPATVPATNATYIAQWTTNQYTVTFDANGGIGGKTVTQNYGTAIIAPTVTRTGYVFAGWTPAVAAALPASNVTYAAQWTLRKYTVTFDANGGVYDGDGISIDYGSAYGELPTPIREGYTFAGWTLGGEPITSESVIGAADVALVAQWTENQYTVTFDANGGDGGKTVTQDYGSALAAPTMTRTGYTFAGWSPAVPATVPTTNATYVAQWTINQYIVLFDTNGGIGGVTNGQDYASEIVEPTVTRTGYTFVGWTPAVDATVPASNVTYTAQWLINTNWIEIGTASKYETEADGAVILDLGACVESLSTPKISVKGLPTGLKYDSKTMTISGKATKPGVYTVTVSATNATVKKAVTATFEIVVPNLTSEALPGLEQGTDAYGVVTCGVAFDPGLVDCSPEDGWTVKVAGLPAGLKYDAKTGKITGVPTKAGTFTVTFTASKKGEANQVATITLNVEAAPEWAVGTFAGSVTGTGNGERGTASMTVAANGKISGKIAISGTNWTFKADSFSRVESGNGELGTGNGGVAFIVNAVATAGKEKREIVLRVVGGGFIETALPVGLINAKAEGETDDGEWSIELWRGIWKDKLTADAAKTEIAKWVGVYTLSLAPGTDYGSGYLSLTVGKDGNVKATGKLADGTSASATSPLMYDEDAGWFVYLYAAPSAYKGGAFAAAVGFDVSTAVSSKPPYRLLPVMFVPWWSSKNPQATGEYGDGFEREVDMVGAYYDKLQKLNEYYEALRLSFDGGGFIETALPRLGYVYKETYFNDLGRKTTDLVNMEADAENTLGQAGLTASVNEKGAFVVEKATKPVQDRETKEWSYNGANDGALALSFTQATGIFKGSYTFWYDYESAYDHTTGKSTVAHTSKKVSFDGILVQGDEPTMDGFYLWDATGEYEDIKTGKIKTYKFKESYPVRLER